MEQILRSPHTFAMLIPLAGIIGGLLIAVAAIITSNWRRVKQAEFEASLKAQMLDQGRTIDEIERVLAAGRRGGRRSPGCGA